MPLTQVQSGMMDSTAQYYSFKNRIINGAMVIDQRNAGASGTAATYTVDRWTFGATQSARITWQQNAGSVTPPAGFTNYLGFTTTNAYSVTASDIFQILQNIEGFNAADLAWGTASAATVTLSFWVRSSLTGTFGGAVSNSALNRSYPFSYTISSANTWEQKSVTIPGDTTGTWLTNNGVGVRVFFSLGMGSTYSGTAGAWAGSDFRSATGATSVVGTNGATFYITGVQLEKGSTATSFDYRPYGTELALCQRYFYTYVSGTTQAVSIGSCFSATRVFGGVTFPVTMRAAPTISASSGTGFYQFYYSGTVANFSAPFLYISSPTNYIFEGTTSGVTTGVSGWIQTANASSLIAFSAEL